VKDSWRNCTGRGSVGPKIWLSRDPQVGHPSPASLVFPRPAIFASTYPWPRGWYCRTQRRRSSGHFSLLCTDLMQKNSCLKQAYIRRWQRSVHTSAQAKFSQADSSSHTQVVWLVSMAQSKLMAQARSTYCLSRQRFKSLKVVRQAQTTEIVRPLRSEETVDERSLQQRTVHEVAP
jgi:hypothetical protein